MSASDSTTPTKRCTTCGVEYPNTLKFFFWRSDSQRLNTRCKNCVTLKRYGRPIAPWPPVCVPDGYKLCNLCHEELPLSAFYHYRAKIGSRCIKCESVGRGYTPKRRDIPFGFKHCNACDTTFPATTDYFFRSCGDKTYGLASFCKTCHVKKVSEWQKRNPDKAKKNRAKSNIRHGYKKAGYARRSRLEKPEQHRSAKVRRRARKLNLPSEFSTADWKYCLNYWKNHCAYCGNPPGLFYGMRISADHFIALSDPRPDNPGTTPLNIIPACKSCNSSKNNSQVPEWLVNKFGKRRANKILKSINAYFEHIKERQQNG